MTQQRRHFGVAWPESVNQRGAFMIDLFLLILPLYLLIGIGFLATRTQLLAPGVIPALGSFVLNIALPALIINALMSQNLQETINIGYLLAYGFGSLAAFGLVFLLFRVVLRRPLSQAAIAAFGGSASNSGFVGLPVVTLVLGTTALTAVPLTMLIENLVIIPLALALAEIGQHREKTLPAVLRETARSLVRSPLLLSILAGAVLSASGIQFPSPVARTISLLAAAAVPCALLIVGGMLANMQVRSFGSETLWITIAKLAVHPLAVALVFMFVDGVPADLRAAGIILAASPMVSIYPIIGARFGQERMTAAALFAATALSFITITIVLSLSLG